MADAGVTGVVAKLGELAAAEATALLRVDDEIRVLRRKLAYLQAMIRGADRQRRGQAGELLLLWLQDTRDVAFEVEDAVDEFHLRVERLQAETARRRRSWSRNWVNLLRGFAMQISVRHGLSSQIAKINERIDEINHNKETYRIENSLPGIWIPPPTITHAAWDEDKYVVGLDSEFETLKARILNSDGKVSRRAIVSVIGASGIGKTTLARKLFENPKIKKHFEIRTWICLPPHIRFVDYVEVMYKQASLQVPEAPEMDGSFDIIEEVTRSKEHKLLQHLRGRRYLVVLDGLSSISDWNSLLDVLPDNSNGSRILLTTRLSVKEIKHTDPDIPPLELTGFDSVHVQELFCRQVFGAKEPSEISDSMTPYMNIICKITAGLPLAVVVLAGILKSKVIPDEWDALFGHLESGYQAKQLKSVWSLSFDDLPHNLKSCFLYFAAMPENVLLSADRLVRLWIAEGFLMPKKGETLEEVGLSYLKELISRGLVQVIEKGVEGGIKLVTVHDVLHAFVQSEAQESCFLEIHHRANVLNPTAVRRLALHNYMDLFVHIPNAFPKLRSLLCDFAEDQGSNLDPGDLSQPQTFWSDLAQLFLTACGFSDNPNSKNSHGLQFLRGSKFLRVIDLYGLKLRKLPEEIGSIIHLRYLGIRNCNLEELPSSIGDLDNLQTLDIRRTKVMKAADALWEIEGLRHVLAGKLSLPRFTVALNHLKTLEGVEPSSPWDSEKSCPLNNIIYLRSLDMSGLLSSHKEALSTALKKLEFLVNLKLAGKVLPSSVFTNPSLRRLQVLALHGKLDGLDATLPGRYTLPNVTTLCLSSSELSQQFINKLASLPSLADMELSDGSYCGTTLVFPENGFWRLAKLKLRNLDELEELVVKPGAMPTVSSIIMYDCARMKRLQGLQDTEHLQEVVVCNMDEIVTAIQHEDTKLYNKIKCLTTTTNRRDRGLDISQLGPESGSWARSLKRRSIRNQKGKGHDDIQIDQKSGSWVRELEIPACVKGQTLDDIDINYKSGAWIRSLDD